MNQALINDIIDWDIKAWSKALYYWEKNTNWDTSKNALELGGRRGGLSVWLAQKGLQVICSDYENTEKTALPLHQKHGLENAINYQDIDATSIPYENHFDIIVFKSIVGGIGRGNDFDKQKKVFDEIYKALKPGGSLLFAENMVATKGHQKLRNKFTTWNDYWRYLTVKELENCLEPFETKKILTTGVLGTFGRSEKQKSFLTRIDETILNPIVPETWKYIGYGIAIKGKQ